MRKSIPLLVTLALTLMAVPFPATADDPVPQVVLLTPTGIVVGPASDNSQPECSGDAPDSTYCTTGVHAATVVNSIGLMPSFGGTYTLEVRLIHAQVYAPTVFQAHFIDGEFAGGYAYGYFPTVGVFLHECFAYELASNGDEEVLVPLLPNGTPGGSGAWGCMVNYEP